MLQIRPKDTLRVLRRTGWTPFTEPTCLSVCLSVQGVFYHRYR